MCVMRGVPGRIVADLGLAPPVRRNEAEVSPARSRADVVVLLGTGTPGTVDRQDESPRLPAHGDVSLTMVRRRRYASRCAFSLSHGGNAGFENLAERDGAR